MILSRTGRVNMIREVARALKDLPTWPETDLVLSQFGFDTYRDHDAGYLFEALREGADDDIVELHQHLFPDAHIPDAAPAVSDTMWQAGQLRLFISHISADKLIISELKQRLAHWHIDAFVAHEDIEPTREWLGEIEVALRTCHALLAYLTPDFHASNYTDHEVGFCVSRRVLIVPVKIGVDPYGFISRYQALRGQDVPLPRLAAQIAGVLAAHPDTSRLMAESLVATLETSGSFEGTRNVMAVIETVTDWTAQQLQRMEQAAEANRQVREATMPRPGTREYVAVPERIQELMGQYSR
ncbi:MAG: toll/interleukin-1 receptor domain-containing protein [Acidimicrobiales bacterium]